MAKLLRHLRKNCNIADYETTDPKEVGKIVYRSNSKKIIPDIVEAWKNVADAEA